MRLLPNWHPVKSLAMVKAAVANVLLGHKVLYITMEMDELGISQRFTSQMMKMDVNNLLNFEAEVKSNIEEFVKDKEDKNLLRITQFPGGQMTVNSIRAYHNQLMLRGWKPNLIIIDYVGEMADDPNGDVAEGLIFGFRSRFGRIQSDHSHNRKQGKAHADNCFFLLCHEYKINSR